MKSIQVDSGFCLRCVKRIANWLNHKAWTVSELNFFEMKENSPFAQKTDKKKSLVEKVELLKFLPFFLYGDYQLKIYSRWKTLKSRLFVFISTPIFSLLTVVKLFIFLNSPSPSLVLLVGPKNDVQVFLFAKK